MPGLLATGLPVAAVDAAFASDRLPSFGPQVHFEEPVIFKLVNLEYGTGIGLERDARPSRPMEATPRSWFADEPHDSEITGPLRQDELHV